jgi:hypothetical protein
MQTRSHWLEKDSVTPQHRIASLNDATEIVMCFVKCSRTKPHDEDDMAEEQQRAHQIGDQ